MLSFNAAAFYKVTSAMQHTLTSLEAKRDAAKNDKSSGDIYFDVVYDTHAQFLLDRAKELQISLLQLEAKVTSQAANEMIIKLQSEEVILYNQIEDWYKEIHSSLKRELGLKRLFVIEDRKIELYEQDEPLFGAVVQSKFPAASFEIDEAGKCIALGRYTASVFHLMRVLEIGIAGSRGV